MASFSRLRNMFVILMVVSIVVSFIISESGILGLTQTLLENMEINNTENMEINNTEPIHLDAKQMEQCWYQTFSTLFVPHKLHHTFNKSHDDIICNRAAILLQKTNQILTKYVSNVTIDHSDHNNFNYRSLISIRRIIMLLHITNTIRFDIQRYDTALSTIAVIEHQYVATYRNNYTVFNIHPPRSAGTYICGWFKRAKRFQLSSRNKPYFVYQRPIVTHPEPTKNCNAWDGGQFTRYTYKTKTCFEQYTNHNLTMIARETPLYPNNNKYGYKHPLLCDQFVYLFPFRSPIERIVSWAQADTRFQITNNQTRSGHHITNYQWINIDKTQLNLILSNFYGSLFDYTLNREEDKIIKHHDGDTKPVRIKSMNKFIRSYSSNAMTKWIGYQWKKQPVNGRDTIYGLTVSTEEVNRNDLHFYNAVQLMLKIDYVLNFASYEGDESAVKATKFAQKEFENIVGKYTQIGDVHSMWSIMAKHMNIHFNTTQPMGMFKFERKKDDKPRKAQWSNVLTVNDWKTLYRQNYYDFRLYSLAKYIDTVDFKYYTET